MRGDSPDFLRIDSLGIPVPWSQFDIGDFFVAGGNAGVLVLVCFDPCEHEIEAGILVRPGSKIVVQLLGSVYDIVIVDPFLYFLSLEEKKVSS